MSSFIRTFAQFMNKLNNINWTAGGDGLSLVSSSRELKSKDGKWVLTYSYEEMTSLHDRSVPIRIIIRVRYEGQHLTQWGCEDNESNALFIEWFQKQRNAINEAMYQEEKLARKAAKEVWDKL